MEIRQNGELGAGGCPIVGCEVPPVRYGKSAYYNCAGYDINCSTDTTFCPGYYELHPDELHHAE